MVPAGRSSITAGLSGCVSEYAVRKSAINTLRSRRAEFLVKRSGNSAARTHQSVTTSRYGPVTAMLPPMPARRIHGAAGLKEVVGEHLGYSDWMQITQERVNQFAEATGDFQWIHIDPERAVKESPF